MPRLSVWLVRAALLHLGVGFTVGALMLYHKGNPTDPAIWRLLAVHIELVLIGWTMQLAMGVAFWVMPRQTGTHKYGVAWLAGLAFVLINAGVLITALSGWGGDKAGALTLLGRSLEVGSALAFALQIWPRVRAFGAQVGKTPPT